MAKAMILAAGFGTRLRPLTLELPKPLVWVGDRPAIALVAERLVAAGVREIVINTHHQAEAFSVEMLARVPGEIAVIEERGEILGTGGGVANAARLLGDGDVVVWNGDILAPLDVRALLSAHAGGQEGPPPERAEASDLGAAADPQAREARRGRGRVGATLAVAPRARGEGTVGLGADGSVVRLRGERFGEEVAGGDFLGISVIGAELRRRLPAPGCLVGDGLLPWLRAGGRVGALVVELTWEDIGSIDAYLRANAKWLLDAGKTAHVGVGARVDEGVELVGSIVGDGATVRGAGRVERCVIWPGATATAPLADVVVTTAGRVVRAAG